MKSMTINRLPAGLGRPAPYALAAFCSIALESSFVFDGFAQKPFFQGGKWLLSRTFHEQYKWLLYTGPKFVIGTIGICVLFVFMASFFSGRLQCWRKPALLVVLSVALVPLAVSAFKAVSGVYGPVDLIPYGGSHPHIGLLERLWEPAVATGGRSFPAGHASGGFALMSLYYLPLRRSLKLLLLASGFLAGWGMGIYQMARGEHFLSHTLTSMFLALAIITLLAYCLDRPGSPAHSAGRP